DPRFGWAVLRSLAFAGGSTLGCFVVGFLLAYLIYRPFRGQALYYALFILPMLTVPIVIAYTGQMLLDRNGPLNDILSRLTGHDIQVLWLSNPDIALLTVTLLDIWNWTPFSFIIMLAGLSSLPKEPIEAAQILGASAWRIFWEVQLPLLRPVILLALVLRFLDAMGSFPIIWGLLQGGPGTATSTCARTSTRTTTRRNFPSAITPAWTPAAGGLASAWCSSPIPRRSTRKPATGSPRTASTPTAIWGLSATRRPPSPSCDGLVWRPINSQRGGENGIIPACGP